MREIVLYELIRDSPANNATVSHAQRRTELLARASSAASPLMIAALGLTFARRQTPHAWRRALGVWTMSALAFATFFPLNVPLPHAALAAIVLARRRVSFPSPL